MNEDRPRTTWHLEGKIGEQPISASLTEPEPTQAKPRLDWFKILGQAGLVVGLVGAWLLLAGWIYAYTYFYKFGLGISGLAISPNDYTSYGYLIAARYWYWMVLAFGLVLLCAAVAARKGPETFPTLAITAIAVLVIGLFILAAQLGRAMAHADYDTLRNNDYPGMHRVIVHVDGDWAKTVPDLAASLTDRCHRLFFADAERLYLIRPLKGQSALWPPVTAIARDHILTYRLLPQTDSCPP